MHRTAAALVLVVCASCNREPSRSDTATVPAAGAIPPPAAGASAGPHRMSPEGLARIRQHEAFIPRVYDDGVGNQTVGYGHMLRSGESFPGGLTEAQAQALFEKDVERIVNPVLDRITVPLTQNQVDALGSFIFNVGPGNFTRSVLPNLNRGDHPGVIARIREFVMGRNQRTGERITLRGLLRRRQEEIALYQTPGRSASFRFPGQEWSRAARRRLANGMEFLRVESACLFDSCRASSSPS